MEQMEQKVFVAAKAVVVYDGKAIIIRESKLYSVGTNIGTYDIPGGRLKPGEHLADGLKREIFEETGLKIKKGPAFCIDERRIEVHNEKWQIFRVFFACQAESNNVKINTDHDDYLWIDPREYAQYNIIDNLRPIFEQYLKKFKKENPLSL